MVPFSLYEEAYRVPTSRYATQKTGRIAPEEIMCTHMGATGVTNATSTAPVIGTVAFNPCTALILYNRKTKAALVMHQPELSPKDVEHGFNKICDNASDFVEMHLFGAPYNPERSTTQNDATKQRLEAILGTMKEHPNCHLATFDVYDKPKPWNVAIDTRTGKLIRGSELFSTFQEAKADISNGAKGLAGEWPCCHGDFDGTLRTQQQHLRR